MFLFTEELDLKFPFKIHRNDLFKLNYCFGKIRGNNFQLELQFMQCLFNMINIKC